MSDVDIFDLISGPTTAATGVVAESPARTRPLAATASFLPMVPPPPPVVAESPARTRPLAATASFLPMVPPPTTTRATTTPPCFDPLCLNDDDDDMYRELEQMAEDTALALRAMDEIDGGGGGDAESELWSVSSRGGDDGVVGGGDDNDNDNGDGDETTAAAAGMMSRINCRPWVRTMRGIRETMDGRIVESFRQQHANANLSVPTARRVRDLARDLHGLYKSMTSWSSDWPEDLVQVLLEDVESSLQSSGMPPNVQTAFTDRLMRTLPLTIQCLLDEKADEYRTLLLDEEGGRIVSACMNLAVHECPPLPPPPPAPPRQSLPTPTLPPPPPLAPPAAPLPTTTFPTAAAEQVAEHRPTTPTSTPTTTTMAETTVIRAPKRCRLSPWQAILVLCWILKYVLMGYVLVTNQPIMSLIAFPMTTMTTTTTTATATAHNEDTLRPRHLTPWCRLDHDDDDNNGGGTTGGGGWQQTDVAVPRRRMTTTPPPSSSSSMNG